VLCVYRWVGQRFLRRTPQRGQPKGFRTLLSDAVMATQSAFTGSAAEDQVRAGLHLMRPRWPRLPMATGPAICRAGLKMRQQCEPPFLRTVESLMAARGRSDRAGT